MSYKTYILAFGPHPDDVDCGCGGTLHATGLAGKKNVVIDLTPGQMSTRGNPTQRQEEAQKAAKVLGLYKRENLLMEDFQLADTEIYRKKIVEKIREYKPEVIMFPYKKDRHPDHEQTHIMVKNAIFAAGLAKYHPESGEIHRPRLSLEYMIRETFVPDIIMGLEKENFDAKMNAFNSFGSQIATNKRAEEYFIGRAHTLGFEIGKSYGEGFKMHQGITGIESFDNIYTRAF